MIPSRHDETGGRKMNTYYCLRPKKYNRNTRGYIRHRIFFVFFYKNILYIIVSKTQKAELEVYYLHCIIATFPKTKPALINFSLFYFFFFFLIKILAQILIWYSHKHIIVSLFSPLSFFLSLLSVLVYVCFWIPTYFSQTQSRWY